MNYTPFFRPTTNHTPESWYTGRNDLRINPTSLDYEPDMYPDRRDAVGGSRSRNARAARFYAAQFAAQYRRVGRYSV